MYCIKVGNDMQSGEIFSRATGCDFILLELWVADACVCVDACACVPRFIGAAACRFENGRVQHASKTAPNVPDIRGKPLTKFRNHVISSLRGDLSLIRLRYASVFDTLSKWQATACFPMDAPPIHH